MNYLDKAEVKTLLKLGDKQAEALFKMENFPSVRIGTKWLIEETDLKQYLAENKAVKLDYRGISKPIGNRYTH